MRRKISVSAEELGLPVLGGMELWNKKVLSGSGKISTVLAPHDALLYHLFSC